MVELEIFDGLFLQKNASQASTFVYPISFKYVFYSILFHSLVYIWD